MDIGFRAALVEGIWGHELKVLEHGEEYDSYWLSLFERELHYSSFIPGVHVLETFGDLFDVIDTIRKSHHSPVRETKAVIADWMATGTSFPRNQNKEYVRNSIDLAARCWLMFGFRSGTGPGAPVFQWDDDMTLEEAVLAELGPTLSEGSIQYTITAGTFSGAVSDPVTAAQSNPVGGAIVKRYQDKLKRQRDYRTFSRLFTLRQMVRLVSIQVSWTNDILKHLCVDDSEKDQFRISVYIFHDVTVLREMWLFTCDGEHYPYRKLAEETLWTLALLIPNNVDSRDWFKKERHAKENQSEWPGTEGLYWLNAKAGKQYLQPRVIPADPVFSSARRMWEDNRIIDASRRVDSFHYWKPRLLVLEQTFRAASPINPAQFWLDRRDRRQCCTFWIATLGFFFIVTGLVFSIASMVGTFQSLRATKDGNDLSKEAIELARKGNDRTMGRTTSSLYLSQASSAGGCAACCCNSVAFHDTPGIRGHHLLWRPLGRKHPLSR
ncbi:hypothetical protein B0T21DRAFT_413691 [Apiosordaria backusii]|uniref:Uncharacterized protein n=1 Tax=Apiosordaria backusii TaxID=314023 RepID=A0AA40B2C5_9PEZI|nr:hypothetical protein B0T21DRAFT_413691 [Apiosordaria backusii]